MRFAFIFFTVTSTWTLLSILTAVVSDHMISETMRQEAELAMLNQEENQEEHMAELRALFDGIDVDNNGFLDENELRTFLKDPSTKVQCAQICQVAAHEVVEIVKSIRSESQKKGIKFDQFLQTLTDMRESLTMKSIIVLEARQKAVEQQVDAVHEAIEETARRQAEWQRKQEERLTDILESLRSKRGRMSVSLSTANDRGSSLREE